MKNNFVSEISGGQKQRVNLARALINKANLVVLDEPTGNLDDDTTEKLLLTLKEYSMRNINFLIITHDIRVTTFFSNILNIENNEIKCTKQFEEEICTISKFEKINLMSNTFYKISKLRNKKHFFMNVIIVSLALICVILISLFLFSKNNQFIDTIDSMFNTRSGIIQTAHFIELEDGECDNVMGFDFCGYGVSPIPWYEGFSAEEEEYLKNYPGMEDINFITDDNDQITYNNTTLTTSSIRNDMENYMNATGDEVFSDDRYVLQPQLLFTQPSILQNYGSLIIQSQLFNPIVGEVHDLEPDEIVIPESYAKALAYKNSTTIDALVGQEFKFESSNKVCVALEDKDNSNGCIVPEEITYKIAWIYAAGEGDNLIYLPPLQNTETQRIDYDYSSGYQMFFMSGIDNILVGLLEGIEEQYTNDLNSLEKGDRNIPALEEFMKINSSLENKKKSLQTGDTEIYYLLKEGYSQKDFTEYLQKGPNPLKYREVQNPYVLLNNKSYNDNYQRMYIIIVITIISSIVILVLQNIYLKVIINELRLARLMGYTKEDVNNILFKHLASSYIFEVIIATIFSTIVMIVINYLVTPIYLNIYNILSLGAILILIGLVSFIFHYIIVLKIDVKKELHD